MSDYELYGDYNATEEEKNPKSKSKFLLVLKIVTAVICISVIAVLAFRMILAINYPASMKKVYFNDRLNAYYDATGGNIGAKTQMLRTPYDDAKTSSFFCDEPVFIEGAGQLQITIRYNSSSLDRIAADNGLEKIADDDFSLFQFSLTDDYERTYNNVAVVATDSRVMYRYIRLVFDDVQYTYQENADSPIVNTGWIRLNITVRGSTTGKVYMIPVYENHEKYNLFEDYKVVRE